MRQRRQVAGSAHGRVAAGPALESERTVTIARRHYIRAILTQYSNDAIVFSRMKERRHAVAVGRVDQVRSIANHVNARGVVEQPHQSMLILAPNQLKQQRLNLLRLNRQCELIIINVTARRSSVVLRSCSHGVAR